MQTATRSTRGFFEKLQVLSGAQLKYIAMLSMLIDHVNKALIYPNLNGGALLAVSNFFDILGRIAFPLFCFFLVEGFFQTRSRGKYLAWLLVFGVISEVPFDLFSGGVFWEPNANNIMFTFALLLLALWVIEVLKDKLPKGAWFPVSFVIIGATSLATMLAGVDYEYHAILTGYFFYLFRSHRAVAIPCSMISLYKEPWALLGFGLTLTYNGKRGRQSKWLNYWFYPVHLLILGLLRLHFGL